MDHESTLEDVDTFLNPHELVVQTSLVNLNLCQSLAAFDSSTVQWHRQRDLCTSIVAVAVDVSVVLRRHVIRSE